MVGSELWNILNWELLCKFCRLLPIELLGDSRTGGVNKLGNILPLLRSTADVLTNHALRRVMGDGGRIALENIQIVAELKFQRGWPNLLEELDRF